MARTFAASLVAVATQNCELRVALATLTTTTTTTTGDNNCDGALFGVFSCFFFLFL